jgi:hypothetical protein
MVAFKKLREGKAKPKAVNPREIFNALPKPPGINDLYASQVEVLETGSLAETSRTSSSSSIQAAVRPSSRC